MGTLSCDCSLTDQDHEVINCTRSCVKIKSKLTNLMKISRLRGIMVNMGRIHRELGKFLMISSNLIKSDDESMIELGKMVYYKRELQEDSTK